jgi:hypothetical protein
MLQRHYGEAIRVLKRALADTPGDNRLRVEIARAYVYNGEDRRAIHLFRDVLRQEPTNRAAKLGLAQVLGYRGSFAESDRLYRELLVVSPADEAAAIGLVNNLMRQKRAVEASRLAQQALAWHPNSLRLQEYKDRIEQGSLGSDERVPRRTPSTLLGYGDYVADSEGNRFWQLSQRFDSAIAPVLSNRLEIEERRLWKTGDVEPPVTVASATEEMRLRLMNPVWLTGGVGLVRFPGGADRALYSGGLRLLPRRRLWLEGSFSRRALYPTAQAADLDLLMEGWQTLAYWQPGRWELSGRWSTHHISDGNHVVRESGEVLRWIGGSRFSFGPGYRYTHYEFSQHLESGYFSPGDYKSHLGIAGFSFRKGRTFQAEYVARIGAETVQARYRFAWDVALHNRLLLGNWELGAEYFYYRLAEITGAYSSQGGRLSAAYKF